MLLWTVNALLRIVVGEIGLGEKLNSLSSRDEKLDHINMGAQE